MSFWLYEANGTGEGVLAERIEVGLHEVLHVVGLLEDSDLLPEA